MRVLLVDTETSGLSYDEGARVIEVAAMLFDTRHASAVESFACLIKHGENAAENVNGVPVSLLLEQGLDPEDVWERFLKLARDADCFVAHRAEFDRGFCCKSIEAVGPDGMGPSAYELYDPAKPWVCTKSDIDWPNGLRGDHLAHLALGMGLGVASAHRAATDVDTMARILSAAQKQMTLDWLSAEFGFGGPRKGELPGHCDFLEPLLRRAMRPKTRVVASVSYDQRQLAKDAGFFWDDKRREWYRMMPTEDIAALPFRAVERA